MVVSFPSAVADILFEFEDGQVFSDFDELEKQLGKNFLLHSKRLPIAYTLDEMLDDVMATGFIVMDEDTGDYSVHHMPDGFGVRTFPYSNKPPVKARPARKHPVGKSGRRPNPFSP